MMTILYLASPLALADRTRAVALRLAAAGYKIGSRWHDKVSASSVIADPIDPATRREILYENLNDIFTSDMLIALCDRGTPRATFGEIGTAIAYGKPVIWVHGRLREGLNIYDAHELVTHIDVPNGAYSDDIVPLLKLALARAA